MGSWVTDQGQQWEATESTTKKQRLFRFRNKERNDSFRPALLPSFGPTLFHHFREAAAAFRGHAATTFAGATGERIRASFEGSDGAIQTITFALQLKNNFRQIQGMTSIRQQAG